MRQIKHIMLVGNTAWSMCNFRGGLIRHLVECGYRVSVLAPEEASARKRIEESGAAFYDLPLEAKGTNPIKDFQLLLRLKRMLKAIKPDFAFFYTIKPNIYGGFAAHACGVPFIAVTTGLGYTFIENNWVSRIARRMYKFSFKNARKVWFLNQEDCKDFLRYRLLPADKCFVLKGEGVDTKRFAAEPLPHKPVFLLMARMLWDKGIGEYVEAARMLKREFPDAEFNLLGFLNVENPSAISRRQMDAWVEEGLVNYLGVTSDVVPYLRETLAIVLPSYREGIPVTLLEAASMQRIVVTSDAVGCRDVVDDGKTGFMCRVKDAQSLADKMRQVIVMKDEQRMRMGQAAREKVLREFDQQLVFDQYDRVLENME
ncbi:MAG: glycosyltransferase family 4 protein [Paludibacteraceae bacterium]|nr:glycosyltransferase family 4 protein [Paludibacteraceae bacterium]